MKKLFIVVLVSCISFTLLHAQCEGTTTAGLQLAVAPVDDNGIPNQVQIAIHNSSDEVKYFCWYDLARTFGLPLCFSISVSDTNKSLVQDKFNWDNYLKKNRFAQLERKSEKIEIKPGQTYTQNIILYWEDIHPGKYVVQFFAGSGAEEIASNQQPVEIK